MEPEEQSSRKKRKQLFILFFIIFTLIICAIISVLTVLKHEIDSESLSNVNPMEAICEFTRYYSHCTKTQSSNVFGLSIDTALQEFLLVYQLPLDLAKKAMDKSIRPVLIDCQNHSVLSQRNASLIVMITRNYDQLGMMKDLRVLMKHAMENVEMCVDGILDAEINNAKKRIEEAVIYMLGKDDLIREMFYPSFTSVFASLVSGENYVVIAVFCSQYVFLVVLVAFLLKIFT